MKRKDLILNPYFISGLFILLLNDFFLKAAYGNFLTGKLSDFAGLLIFPMFIAAIFPKHGKYVALITGLGFILWKLPLFTPVVDWLNQLPLVNIHRVIDYSDYMALLILPLSHYLINKPKDCSVVNEGKIKYVSHLALSAVAFFAFCATSVPPQYLYGDKIYPEGTVLIDKSYNIKLPKDSIINTIKQLGYNCDFHDKDSLNQYSMTYYQTDNLVRQLRNSTVPDTVANVKYQLTEIDPGKTKLTVINVSLYKKNNIQNWKTLKQLRRVYSSWLKQNFIEEIKE